MKKFLIKAILAVTACIFVALGVACTNNSKKDSQKNPSSGGSGVIETPMIKFD